MHGSSSREHFSANTPENALDFVIERYLKGKLNTALPVRVVAVTRWIKNISGGFKWIRISSSAKALKRKP